MQLPTTMAVSGGTLRALLWVFWVQQMTLATSRSDGIWRDAEDTAVQSNPVGHLPEAPQPSHPWLQLGKADQLLEASHQMQQISDKDAPVISAPIPAASANSENDGTGKPPSEVPAHHPLRHLTGSVGMTSRRLKGALQRKLLTKRDLQTSAFGNSRTSSSSAASAAAGASSRSVRTSAAVGGPGSSSVVSTAASAASGSANDPLTSSLHELARVDPVSALLEHIERVQSRRNCSRNTPLFTHERVEKLSKSDKRFAQQINSAVKIANVLNNLFRTWDTASPAAEMGAGSPGAAASTAAGGSASAERTAAGASPKASKSVYNDHFYFSLVRGMLEDDADLFGVAVAFDKAQYDRRDFCPYAYKDRRSGELRVTELARTTKGRYASNGTDGYEWFWRLRAKNFSYMLWKHRNSCSDQKMLSAEARANHSHVESTIKEGQWTHPYFDCSGARSWMVTYSVPFFGCNAENQLQFKGVVAVNIDLARVDINQCATDESFFAKTHKCPETTECRPVPNQGFRRGSYQCACAKGYYFPPAERTKYIDGFYNGSEVERSYLNKLRNMSSDYDIRFRCKPCQEGCSECTGDEPCFVEYDMLIRGVPLGIQSFCMTITLVLGLVIMKIRKSKHHMGREVMRVSMWVMLETVLLGAMISYATVIIQYFKPTTVTCLLMPWFREVGFAIIYGALILKVYRVLAEFQSRKAHRVQVRDRDLLKYLLGIVLVVVGYMSAWTAVNMDHVRDGDTMIATGSARVTENASLEYHICKSFWWDYVIEVGEFLFLCFGIYLCYCVRSAPSDYSETRYISWAIYNETAISALLHIIRHFIWLDVHPDYIFLMYFLRCQLTVTMTLILVLGPKLWYAHHPPGDDHIRGRVYSAPDVHDTILPESMKLHVGVSSNGDVDVGEVNLAEMDPEDIRAELKRLYTQLQIYKTKTMRKDNPHIPKRRGGRKQTHRRFSIPAFHYKHRHHHDAHDSHDHELSKTPEESTNSAEGVAIQMEPSSCSAIDDRAPTVTFKPGHKSFS